MECRWEAATRDRATGLPNAAIFKDRLGQALENGRRRQQPVCVLVATIWPGDEHEVAVAGERIEAALRGSDTVARLGSRELGMILPGLGRRDHAAAVVERIRAASGGRLFSVGFAFSGDAAGPEALLFLAQRRQEEHAA